MTLKIINDKDIRLTNKKAIRLVKQRALKENRSASNALAQTVIEALQDSNNKEGIRQVGDIKQ